MPRAAKRFQRRAIKGKSFKQLVDNRRYDSRWAKVSRHFLENNPVCFCDRVKVWNGKRVTVVALAKEGTFRPAKLTDHVRPLSKGGKDTDGNYQALCLHCHAKKTKRWG